MPPTVALAVWFVLLIGLLWLDPARTRQTSFALWIPLTWMFIVGSRLPSQWLGGHIGSAAQAFEEGNALDRSVFIILIILALCVLTIRSFNWNGFIQSHFALALLLSFALVSVIWSDFPFVSLKRWIRDLGTYLVIFVVLSDTRPLEAVRVLLRRLFYLLIPLSILVVKYYPEFGKRYNFWTGKGYFVGVSADKNNLGVLCLVSGLFFFWDIVSRWSGRQDKRVKKIIYVDFVLFIMSVWLLKYADSATSRVSLLLGVAVILATSSKVFSPRTALVRVMIPVILGVSIAAVFAFGFQAQFAGAVGRDPTLTDRTELWHILLSMRTNPLIGTGYESFWLGSRFAEISRLFSQVNEAHNGYLEVYLNLGLVGLILLVGFLIASYGKICKRFATSPQFASFNLALWVVLIVYNITEAAFRMQLMWATFLLVTIGVPVKAEEQAPALTPIRPSAESITILHASRVEPQGLRRRDFARPKRR